MSTNISVSNIKQNNCDHIIKMMKIYGQDCRVIETTSLVNNNIEKGCHITMEKFKKKKLKDIWNVIKTKGEYKCAHLEIDGIFSGCIYNYLNADFCPK